MPGDFERLFMNIQQRETIKFWYKNVFFRIERPGFVGNVRDDIVYIKATMIVNNKKYIVTKEEDRFCFNPTHLNTVLNLMVRDIFNEAMGAAQSNDSVYII